MKLNIYKSIQAYLKKVQEVNAEFNKDNKTILASAPEWAGMNSSKKNTINKKEYKKSNNKILRRKSK